jgi:hypothetical protein
MFDWQAHPLEPDIIALKHSLNILDCLWDDSLLVNEANI